MSRSSEWKRMLRVMRVTPRARGKPPHARYDETTWYAVQTSSFRWRSAPRDSCGSEHMSTCITLLSDVGRSELSSSWCAVAVGNHNDGHRCGGRVTIPLLHTRHRSNIIGHHNTTLTLQYVITEPFGFRAWPYACHCHATITITLRIFR